MRVVLLAVSLCACGKVQTAKPDAPIDAAPVPMLDMAMGPSAIDGEGATAPVSVRVHGEASETITVAFTASLGSYTPASVQVTTDATGYATASTMYTSADSGTESTTMVASDGPAMSTPAMLSFTVAHLARYGNPNAFTMTSAFSPDYLLGQPIEVTASGHLKKMGIITAAAGPMVQIGIYSDSNNAPGTLVAQLPAVAVVEGTNEFTLTSPVELTAGTYWMMAVYSSDAEILREDLPTPTTTVDYVPFTFGGGLPATFPAPTTYMGFNFNYYLVFGG